MANGTVTVTAPAVAASGTLASGDLVGAWVPVHGAFLLAVAGGFTGPLKLEYSPDGGTTVLPLCDSTGTQYGWTSLAGGLAVSLPNADPAGSVRVNGTGMSAGYPAWRIAGRL